MRVAFVSGNREKLPDAVIPLGLVWVATSLAGPTSAHADRSLLRRRAPRRIGERLRAFEPDLVAVGMRNIQSADYSGTADTLAYYGELLAATRAPPMHRSFSAAVASA